MIPLKLSPIIDSTLVDDIFYKVPEILNHHAIFLDFLERAFLNWDEYQTVGQHIRNTVSSVTVIGHHGSSVISPTFLKQTVDQLHISNTVGLKVM
jgi:hypothetical protein